METKTPTIKQLTQKAIKSNITIQNTLTTKVTELEAQLKELDELIDSVHKGVATEEVPEDAFESEIQIPGAKRANSLFPSSELLSQSSPFYQEASQRAHYVRWTSVHPIKGREAEILAEAVKKENMRLEAYRSRNSPAALPIDIENNTDGINWSIVAEKVSDTSPVKRTPDECRIQWVGNLHPRVNHGDWTQDELNKLHHLIANALASGEKPNWARVAKELGTNRIPIECMKQATTRPRHHWDADADQKLLEAIKIFGTHNWNIVARHVSPYVTTSQCQTRYFRSVDPSIKRGPWTSDEDTRLRKGVEAFHNSWIDVASVLPGRTNEQCRERWAEIGGEGGKGSWSAEEDERLLSAVKELGNKWKMVSTRVGGGRTGPNCRLRHDRLMKNRAKQVEGAAAASVQPPSPSALTAPAPVGTAVSSTHSPPESDPRPSKPRPRRTKAVPPPEKPITTVNDQSQTSAGPSNTVPAAVKPRPRPRPIHKGKGKEKADANEDIERAPGIEIRTEQMQSQLQIGDVNANVPGLAPRIERQSTEVQAPGGSKKKRSDQTEGSLSSEPHETVDVSTESARQPRRSVRKKRKVISGEEKGEGASEDDPKELGMDEGVNERRDNNPSGTTVAGALRPGGGRERGRGRGRGRGGGKGQKGGRDGGLSIAPVEDVAEERQQQTGALECQPSVQTLEHVFNDQDD